jgi:anti-sigma factor RsiW
MKLGNHERAKQLLRAVRVEGVPAAELRWLEEHLDACNECSNEAKALDFAIRSLRSLNMSARPEVVRRTSLAVRRRAKQMRDERERVMPLWIAAAVSSIWMIVTAPYTWQAFAWLGRLFHVPNAIWELGFLTWWFLPATVLSAVLAWQHVVRRNTSPNWVEEMNWR